MSYRDARVYQYVFDDYDVALKKIMLFETSMEELVKYAPHHHYDYEIQLCDDPLVVIKVWVWKEHEDKGEDY
jgi:hypothetical protein